MKKPVDDDPDYEGNPTSETSSVHSEDCLVEDHPKGEVYVMNFASSDDEDNRIAENAQPSAMAEAFRSIQPATTLGVGRGFFGEFSPTVSCNGEDDDIVERGGACV